MVAQKRKGPCNTSSFWNILPPRKVSVREQVQQRPCSPLSEVQAPETDIRFDYLAIKHPKNTPFAIIQRSGSKVLTVLGILSGNVENLDFLNGTNIAKEAGVMHKAP